MRRMKRTRFSIMTHVPLFKECENASQLTEEIRLEKIGSPDPTHEQ